MLRATRTFSHAPPRLAPRFTTRLTTLAAESMTRKSNESSKQKLDQTVKEDKENTVHDKDGPKQDIYVVVNV
jgi:hypothetical protein